MTKTLAIGYRLKKMPSLMLKGQHPPFITDLTVTDRKGDLKNQDQLPETVNGAGCFAYPAIDPQTVHITEQDWCVPLSCS